MQPGKRGHRVSFQVASPAARGRLGSTKVPWIAHCEAWAAFIHLKGDVALEGGRVAGRLSMKVCVPVSAKTRQLKPQDQMTHIATSEVFEIRHVDRHTQPGDVYLIVEGPLSESGGNV